MNLFDQGIALVEYGWASEETAIDVGSNAVCIRITPEPGAWQRLSKLVNYGRFMRRWRSAKATGMRVFDPAVFELVAVARRSFASDNASVHMMVAMQEVGAEDLIDLVLAMQDSYTEAFAPLHELSLEHAVTVVGAIDKSIYDVSRFIGRMGAVVRVVDDNMHIVEFENGEHE